jgi:DNA-binding PadR family transcriptional regulator
MFSMFNDLEGGPHMRHRHRHGPRHMHQVFKEIGRDLHSWLEGDHRMRRGDIKFVLLSTLLKRPMHGYEMMQDLEERYEGRYRPSPGSVYPTLQMLEDGGFVTSQVIDGKRVYEITETGRKMLEERGDLEESGVDENDPRAEWGELREAVRKFMAAVQQGLRQIDDRKTRERIKEVLDDARKEIYSILQDD